MGNVVVLGSLNMDLVVRTERIPRPGETVRGHGFTMVPGGKGANQAAAIARLGTAVTMLGRIGQDAFGEAMLKNLREQGVETRYVLVDPEAPSGIAMITVQEDGENAIVVAAGANGRLTPDDVEAARDLLHTAHWLVCQFETPLPVVRHAIALAASVGVRVVLNPAPAYPIDAAFLQGVYCLVVNETEAETLTGLPIDSLAAAEKAARMLQMLGVPIVVVTLGADGAFFVAPETAAHIPAQKVHVVDTTAAGDAFIGGLVSALDRDMPLSEAVRYATCAGTLATTVFGAQTSLPRRDQVDAFYQSLGA